ncbi:hypothetical protein [Actinokineospora sp. NBRC 105648]|uniref:hypothetical protein n=1 Tax=Actinokineospora sp. NBRC 105648 TaxID=3032206 RepID=UPI0024A1B14B|nr:hypothetical protein [Actinokineospora sp. NBRC 105648]GLZ41227.1 hypothetical protein Acsp05_48510 [Actinokineospora sp. NBRC 105648]
MTTCTGTVVDAGPALTFLARKDTTRVLFQGLRGGFAAPEIVRTEVMRKSREKQRLLGSAANQWQMLENAGRIEVLSDDESVELSVAVQRLCHLPMSQRMQQGKDLGELMVIAHAVVLADAGRDVTVLIQERDGTAMAQQEAARFARMAPRRGSIRVWNSETVLLRAAGSPQLPDKSTMRRIYGAMRPLDAALPPIDQTDLLTSSVWNQIEQR